MKNNFFAKLFTKKNDTERTEAYLERYHKNKKELKHREIYYMIDKCVTDFNNSFKSLSLLELYKAKETVDSLDEGNCFWCVYEQREYLKILLGYLIEGKIQDEKEAEIEKQ